MARIKNFRDTGSFRRNMKHLYWNPDREGDKHDIKKDYVGQNWGNWRRGWSDEIDKAVGKGNFTISDYDTIKGLTKDLKGDKNRPKGISDQLFSTLLARAASQKGATLGEKVQDQLSLFQDQNKDIYSVGAQGAVRSYSAYGPSLKDANVDIWGRRPRSFVGSPSWDTRIGKDSDNALIYKWTSKQDIPKAQPTKTGKSASSVAKTLSSKDYGSRIGAPGMGTTDFIDKDRDGTDDRYQTGPGQPRQNAGFPGAKKPTATQSPVKTSPVIKDPVIKDDRSGWSSNKKWWEDMKAKRGKDAFDWQTGTGNEVTRAAREDDWWNNENVQRFGAKYGMYDARGSISKGDTNWRADSKEDKKRLNVFLKASGHAGGAVENIDDSNIEQILTDWDDMKAYGIKQNLQYSTVKDYDKGKLRGTAQQNLYRPDDVRMAYTAWVAAGKPRQEKKTPDKPKPDPTKKPFRPSDKLKGKHNTFDKYGGKKGGKAPGHINYEYKPDKVTDDRQDYSAGIRSAAKYGRAATKDFFGRFIPEMKREAQYDATAMGESTRHHLGRFVGSVPELGDPKELFEYYSGQLDKDKDKDD